MTIGFFKGNFLYREELGQQLGRGFQNFGTELIF